MSATAATARLSDTTSLGAVSLTVRDLARTRAFYEDVLGLRARSGPDGTVTLAAGDDPPLLVLREDPDAAGRDPHAPGLFHVALLVPTRQDLAHVLLRLAHAGWPLDGASDHLVSEALYLADPEGNGIEIYADRPRERWPRDDRGSLRMATLALDLRALAAEAGAQARDAGVSEDPPMADGTRVGHVHLQVADIPRAAEFYAGLLGFDPTVRGYPGALFVSAGGYHHHLGLNTWNSAGAPPARAGAAGLRAFEVILDDDDLTRMTGRLQAAGARPEPVGEDGAVCVRDPFAIAVVLRPA